MRYKDGLKDEGGMALVLALVMLTLMSVLATIMFKVTDHEMQISRNYSWRQDAFYAADSGVEYAQTDANIYTAIGLGTINIPVGGASLAAGASDATGTVEFLASGNPPTGLGVDATMFQGNYYLIKVTGTGRSNSTLGLESSVVRIVPRP
ncbi:hypothetical protein MNBD_DELTA01-1574 [hydrothermal vent metagenome]|uniref:Type 4 fimbrial biogenesis protein PilX N-terminal domain-containing protein n=1 Tax=hydrothermal vent metagenome TaxID=652676 RepID=A0A3B0QUI4_9ZZZZ